MKELWSAESPSSERSRIGYRSLYVPGRPRERGHNRPGSYDHRVHPEVDVFAPDGSLVFDGIASGIGSFDIFLNTFVQTGTYTVLVKSRTVRIPETTT